MLAIGKYIENDVAMFFHVGGPHDGYWCKTEVGEPIRKATPEEADMAKRKFWGME